MSGIGEQRHRVADKAEDAFDQDEAEIERDRDREDEAELAA
jgi:hypothetical protein